MVPRADRVSVPQEIEYLDPNGAGFFPGPFLPEMVLVDGMEDDAVHVSKFRVVGQYLFHRGSAVADPVA